MVWVTTPFSLAAGCPLIPDIVDTGELSADFTEEDITKGTMSLKRK